MTDRVDAIIERTIALTREQLGSARVEWAVARVGLDRVRGALAGDAPDHPALDRIAGFIAEQDRIRRGH